MKANKSFSLLAAALMGAVPVCTTAAPAGIESDSVPSRAIILSGSADNAAAREHIAMMYSRENLAFEDPAAPRFLFLDKKGRVALGIGGYVKGVGMYDVNGAIDDNGFTTYEIPVPFDPAQRQRFGADFSHSTIFLKIVARETRLGRVIVYIQTNFTGGNHGYGLTLKQAYVSVGNFTIGKARTTFADAPAMAPTVDDQGPSGQVSAKNMLVRYITPSWRGLMGAVSLEVPTADYRTVEGSSRSIAQRFPDIPAYIQYQWDGGASHVRLSGILRELSYRDLVAGSNRFATGWGVQLSTVMPKLIGGLGLFGHYTYGKGIASYVNDLADRRLDLVPDPDRSGRLRAQAVAGYTAGLQYQFTPSLLATASYSRAQVCDGASLGNDSYRYAQYVAVNAFYDVWNELRIGVEYLHGTRKDVGGMSGRANRLEAMLQYSF